MICIDIIYCPSIKGKVQRSYYCHYPAHILRKLLHNSVNTAAALSDSYLVYCHLIILFSKVISKSYNINLLFAIYEIYVNNTVPNDMNVLLTKDEMVNRMIVKKLQFLSRHRFHLFVQLWPSTLPHWYHKRRWFVLWVIVVR